MATFSEANQVRLVLKMRYSQYSWYRASVVASIDDDYGVVIGVKHIDNNIRKLIAPFVEGVSIKTEVD